MTKKDFENFEIDAYIHSAKDYYEKLSEPQKKDFEKQITQMLMRSFTHDLELKAKRFLELPRIGPLPLMQKFMQLVPEVIMLYTSGYYYSAIASCGVAAERVCYDIIETADVELDGRSLTFRQKSQLYRVQLSQFVKLLSAWGLVKKDTAKLLEKIRVCRNRYVHPSLENINARNDSLKMITWLFRVVELEFGPGSQSRYVIVNGKLAHVKGRRFWNDHKEHGRSSE
jgi:hypothetical protein